MGRNTPGDFTTSALVSYAERMETALAHLRAAISAAKASGQDVLHIQQAGMIDVSLRGITNFSESVWEAHLKALRSSTNGQGPNAPQKKKRGNKRSQSAAKKTREKSDPES